MIAFGSYEGGDLPSHRPQRDGQSDASHLDFTEGRLSYLPSARSYVVPWLARAE
jgi:hypothetical protein